MRQVSFTVLHRYERTQHGKSETNYRCAGGVIVTLRVVKIVQRQVFAVSSMYWVGRLGHLEDQSRARLALCALV